MKAPGRARQLAVICVRLAGVLALLPAVPSLLVLWACHRLALRLTHEVRPMRPMSPVIPVIPTTPVTPRPHVRVSDEDAVTVCRAHERELLGGRARLH
jgi:hypothetical protein